MRIKQFVLSEITPLSFSVLGFFSKLRHRTSAPITILSLDPLSYGRSPSKSGASRKILHT
jgi:hypothetical protein